MTNGIKLRDGDLRKLEVAAQKQAALDAERHARQAATIQELFQLAVMTQRLLEDSVNDPGATPDETAAARAKLAEVDADVRRLRGVLIAILMPPIEASRPKEIL